MYQGCPNQELVHLQNEIQKTVDELANRFWISLKVENSTVDKIDKVDEEISKFRFVILIHYTFRKGKLHFFNVLKCTDGLKHH